MPFLCDALRDFLPFVQFKKQKKNTHGGVLLLVKLQALAHLHACFSRFLDCTNGTESPNASHIVRVKFKLHGTYLN